MAYFVKVRISRIGADYYDDNGVVQDSLTGHMWYELYDDVANTTFSYGFAPIMPHQAYGEGRPYEDDNLRYIDIAFSSQIGITASEYNSLKSFGSRPQDYGFDLQYNGLTNSCVDFVWSALEYSGIAPSVPLFDGVLLPSDNIKYLRIVDYMRDDQAVAEELKDLPEKQGIAESRTSPLVLDLDGVAGVQLVAKGSVGSVYWDIDSDGFREASGWVAGGDGLLAIDKNGNGKIDNNSELFGNDANFANGFAALAAYDVNNDGRITSLDSAYNTLRVWIDANHNGVSESSELKTLSSLNITSIATTWTDTNIDNNGNTIKQTSTFTQNGATKTIVDAWFAYDNMNTVYAGEYTLDMRSIILPTLRGYGNIPDLHIATSLDQTASGNLFEKVAALDTKTFAQIFDATATLKTDVRNILFKWAGVDGVNPAGRGAFANGQELAFIEKMMGRGFVQQGTSSDPYGPNAGGDLQEIFNISFNHFYARLVTQTAGGQLLTGNWKYNVVTDSFTGVTGLDSTKLNELKTEALGLSSTAARQAFWENVVRMVEYSVGTNNLDVASKTALQNAIVTSDAALTLSGTILPALNFLRPVGVNVQGTDLDNILMGSSSNDYISGLAGNDTFTGLTGDDTFLGGNGDDILNGGVGADYMLGQNGNDLYIYNRGDGADTILESGSGVGHDNDILKFGAGITLSDLSFKRLGNSAVLVTIGGTTPGQIMIEGQVNSSGSVDKIQFNDGSIHTLTDKNYTAYGSDANDSIDGVSIGGGNTDIIYLYDGDDRTYAGAGNDTVYGGNGNDVIYGEAGNDILYGEGGSDTLNGGEGNDIYVYSGGVDTFIDSFYVAGTDEIRMASGIGSANLTFNRLGNFDLKIDVGTLGSITIKNQFDFYTTTPSIETIRFANNGTLNLLTRAYTTLGTAGDDSISGIKFGGLTTDTVYLYDGNDNFAGGVGNDIVYGGNGNDIMYGEDGADTLNGGLGNDTIDGGVGIDTASYVGIVGGVKVNLSLTGAQNTVSAGMDTLISIENLTGSSYSDTLTGNGNNNVIEGGGYNDILDGGTGVDTASYAGATAAVTVNLSLTTAQATGGAGIDTLVNFENIFGSAFNDILTGNSVTNTLTGGNGNDTLDGAAGHDVLDGGAGNDMLIGGTGLDRMTGGAGIDTFKFQVSGLDTNLDRITDFSVAQGDKLDLRDILVGYDPLTKAITDFVEFTTVGANTLVKVDRDGTGTAYAWQSIVQLDNVTGLTDEAALRTSGNLVV